MKTITSANQIVATKNYWLIARAHPYERIPSILKVVDCSIDDNHLNFATVYKLNQIHMYYPAQSIHIMRLLHGKCAISTHKFNDQQLRSNG